MRGGVLVGVGMVLSMVLAGCATPTGTTTSSPGTSGTHASSTTAASATPDAPSSASTTQDAATGQAGAGNATSDETAQQTPPAITAFSANVSSGAAPLKVLFTINATGSGDLAYNLTFGDNTTALSGVLPALNVTHAFLLAGNFTVRLVVTGSGGSANRTLAVNVTGPAGAGPFTRTGTITIGGVENACAKLAGPSAWGFAELASKGINQFDVTLPPETIGRPYQVTFKAGQGAIVGSAITFWKGGSSTGGAAAQASSLQGTIPDGTDNAQMAVCGPAANIAVTFTVT